MQKDVIYKIFSYHLGKVILSKNELTDYIKNLNSEYERRNLESLSAVLHEYKDNTEYIKVDEFIDKAMKENFGVSKSDLYDKIYIDNKLYRVFFEYFNEMQGKKYSFKVLEKSKEDLLTRFEFLEIDYNIIIERQNRTLQDIGNELGYTRERIRQIVNKTKDELLTHTSVLKLNYINVEDIKYLPKYKQAIVYANESNFVSSVGMYIFEPRLKILIIAVTNKFKKMVDDEDDGLDKFVEKNYDIVKRYIQNDPGFYFIQNEMYTIYENGEEDPSKFLGNYLSENKMYSFELNKQFVEKFKKSIHGKLLEEYTDKKLTQKNVKGLTDNRLFLNTTGDQYIYNPNGFTSYVDDYLLDKIAQNLPLRGKKEIKECFKDELNNVSLELDDFYYYLKKIGSKRFKFFKFNIEEK